MRLWQTCLPYPLPACEHHIHGSKPLCVGTALTPKCLSKCSVATYSTSYKKDKHYGRSAYSVSSDMAQIQMEIMTNGPVEAGAHSSHWLSLPFKSNFYLFPVDRRLYERAKLHLLLCAPL